MVDNIRSLNILDESKDSTVYPPSLVAKQLHAQGLLLLQIQPEEKHASRRGSCSLIETLPRVCFSHC